MRIHVISVRSPGVRLLLLAVGLVLATWLVNPRVLHATSRQPFAVYRVDTGRRMMALTINVVWGTEYVPALIRELSNHHAVATFMVGGIWAKTHPALVREMVQAGDEVGNHGWNHRHPTRLSEDELIRDIADTNNVVREIIGRVPTVYAPPYGEFNKAVIRAADSLHMTLVMWTIDTIDWRPSTSAASMAHKVLTKSAPGAIVLMHPTDRTVVALPQIINGLHHRGYQLVTVSQLLKSGTPRPDE
ncbi:MAG: polysaccharide deacetylase family protein [Firmicutes bacterium]|nr:polysaccharide deacetylase family protein [Bacillota bacterium]